MLRAYAKIDNDLANVKMALYLQNTKKSKGVRRRNYKANARSFHHDLVRKPLLAE